MSPPVHPSTHGDMRATAQDDAQAGRGEAGRDTEAQFRGILAADAANEGAWLRLGGLTLDDGRHRMAARCFARLMILAPHRAQAMHNLAEALRLAGRTRQAAIAFTRALRLRPDYPKALAAYGLMLKDAGSGREARRLVARALVADPAFAMGWRNLGALAHERNQPDAVVRRLRRAGMA